MAGRAFVWAALLAVGQLLDVLTTELDRARGAVESMPSTAAVLVSDGLAGWALLKVLLALAAVIALVVTLRWRSRGAPGVLVHRFVLNGCRVTAVAVVLASLNNAVLLTTLAR